MDRKAAIATAAGLVLVVAGAASALTAAWTAPAPAGPAATTTAGATVITEYVDEAGNPVPPPSVRDERVVLARTAAEEPLVIFEEPETIYVDSPAAPAAAAAPAIGDDHESEDEHEDESEDEDEHEDESEDEDEHEDESEDESEDGR